MILCNVLLRFAKFNFHNIQGSVTLLSFFNTLQRKDRSSHINVYLLTLEHSLKAYYLYLYNHDYIIIDTHSNLVYLYKISLISTLFALHSDGLSPNIDVPNQHVCDVINDNDTKYRDI